MRKKPSLHGVPGWCLLATAGLLVSCAGMTPKNKVNSPAESYSEPFENGNKGTLHQFGAPANIAKADKRVALILGPGGYKAFAHVGVIKELLKSEIPINAVVGIEWGALVGAVYAQHGQIHEAEWKLYKLEQLDLNSTGFFSRKRQTQPVSVMTDFLNQNLDNEDISKTSIPFTCPVLSLQKGTADLPTSGGLSQVVQNCLSLPPIFKPTGDLMADPLSIPDIVSRLRGEGYNVIILVNVLDDGNLFKDSRTSVNESTVLLWDEIRRQIWQARSFVTDEIDVNTQGMNMDDFSSRRVLVTAGEAAGDKAAQQLLAKYGF